MESGRCFEPRDGSSAGATRPVSAITFKITQPRQGWVTSIAVDAQSGAVYATYGNFGGAHVFRSIDNAQTWRSLDGSGPTGLPDIPVHSIVVDPDDQRRLYLGTDLGVMVSIDGGRSASARDRIASSRAACRSAARAAAASSTAAARRATRTSASSACSPTARPAAAAPPAHRCRSSRRGRRSSSSTTRRNRSASTGPATRSIATPAT